MNKKVVHEYNLTRKRKKDLLFLGKLAGLNHEQLWNLVNARKNAGYTLRATENYLKYTGIPFKLVGDLCNLTGIGFVEVVESRKSADELISELIKLNSKYINYKIFITKNL